MATTAPPRRATAPDAADRKYFGVFVQQQLTAPVVLHVSEIGENLTEVLREHLATQMEGKCKKEGFVRPNSIRVQTYSAPVAYPDAKVKFQVVFTFDVCMPVEGMWLKDVECDTVSAKAGIRGFLRMDGDARAPVVVYVPRNMHARHAGFKNIKVGTKFTAEVASVRFQLDDAQISVLARLEKEPGESARRRGGSALEADEDLEN